MIAETAVVAAQDATSRVSVEAQQPLSLHRIAAALQVLLATRRAARNEEHAYWYTLARGL